MTLDLRPTLLDFIRWNLYLIWRQHFRRSPDRLWRHFNRSCANDFPSANRLLSNNNKHWADDDVDCDKQRFRYWQEKEETGLNNKRGLASRSYDFCAVKPGCNKPFNLLYRSVQLCWEWSSLPKCKKYLQLIPPSRSILFICDTQVSLNRLLVESQSAVLRNY